MKNNFDVNAVDRLVEQYATQCCAASEEMLYALSTGGKRVRPLLLLDVACALGEVDDAVMRMAVALEFVHTYSLVHDDLPCMDNDDFRRGKPTVHKQFGQARAVLAGDALLNAAMEVLCNATQYSPQYFKAVGYLFGASGMHGMIKGQLLDIEGNVNNVSDVDNVALNKTGRLLQAALVMPLLYFGKDKYVTEAEDIGELLGKTYQLADDLLDNGNIDETSYLKVMTQQQAKQLLIDNTALLHRKTLQLQSALNVKLYYLDNLVQFNALRKA